MSDSFPFTTHGAKNFFGDPDEFGRHYTRVEANGSSFSSVAFGITPAEKISLDVQLSEGEYLLFAGYGFGMSGTNRDFEADVTRGGVTLLSSHIQTVTPSGRLHIMRSFGFSLDKGAYTFKLRFGPCDTPATAEMFDASMMIWRTK